MDTLWGIPELLRCIASHGASGVAVFFTTRAALVGEPCAAEYRRWALHGCPPAHGCLAGIGGADSVFCRGRLLVTEGHRYSFDTEVSPAEASARLDRLVDAHTDELGRLFIDCESGAVRIRAATQPGGLFKMTASRYGWQRRNSTLTLTKADLKSLLHRTLSIVGQVELGGAIVFLAARELSLNVRLDDKDGREWTLLVVSRVAS